MLTPADIIAAKLLGQICKLDPEVIREALRASDADEDASFDLIARLAAAGCIAAPQVKKARRYVALFEHVRYEAGFIKRLEKKRAIARAQLSALIARVDMGTYRRRLGPELVQAGLLSVEQAQKIDRMTRKRIHKDDAKILERYRHESFQGVDRPMVPAKLVTTDVFRVAELFRSKQTLKEVKRAMLQFQLDSPVPPPRVGHHEFAPDGPDGFEDDDDEEPNELLQSARFRPPPKPSGPTSLAERKTIGPYSIIECLGQGGMGAVYLAQEGMSMAAVKVMLSERATAEDVARFEREALITGMLDHKNTLRLIEKGRTEDGLSWMAVSLYAGKSLKDLLDEKGALPLSEAFHLFEQLLEGLGDVHRKGILHKDLKPDNIFIMAGEQRQVRLMDFGIARILDDDKPEADRAFRTKLGVISGTPAYIAPETISGDVVDARTDIYSLGMLFYEMCTGRLPLFAETPYDYLREHLIGIPLTLFQGKKNAYWLPELEELVASLLAKERVDRPDTCEWILGQLRGGLRDRALEAQANPPEEPPKAPGSQIFNSFFKIIGRN